MKKIYTTILISLCFSCILLLSCAKDSPVNPKVVPVDTTKPKPVVLPAFDIGNVLDEYGQYAPIAKIDYWGSYNVHDPSILKIGEYYYCYGTDVAFGTEVKAGIQIRKSKDLVNWVWVGWVFEGLPQSATNFISSNSGSAFNAIWAPYIMKVGTEYRLYYAISCSLARLSVIGLATSKSPTGPWADKGLVVTSLNNNTKQTNAIDPTVVVDPQGGHWFYYGSAWDGIYMLKLNPATGLASSLGDIGKRIANRGFTAGKYNGNIEAPEIIYNPSLKKYFLFIAYDWLQTKYNVRVGRADSPDGPFLDFDGKDMDIAEDHSPMIIAPYKFENHQGWQGTSHCSVFSDDNGQFYIAHQGRPTSNSFYMDMHVRKLIWTQDGWPVASPERYAATEQTEVLKTELVGNWEQIVLNYKIVPGYAEEQTSADLQQSNRTVLNADGSINNDVKNQWTYTAPWLTLSWNMGAFIDKVYVERGRDWENKIASTLVFTGLNGGGTAIWGKKRN